MKLRLTCIGIAFGSVIALFFAAIRAFFLENHVFLAIYGVIGVVLCCSLLLREEVGEDRGNQKSGKIVIMMRRFVITDKYIGRVCGAIFSIVTILVSLTAYLQNQNSG